MADLHGLAGLYALDALDDVERRRFEQHLDSCEDCRREVAGFHDTAAALAGSEPHVPSEPMRDAVLARVARTRQDRPGRPARRSRHAVGWLAAAAAVVLAVLLGAALVRTRSENDRLREVAAVLAAPDAVAVPMTGPEGSAVRFVSSADEGGGVLVAAGLAGLPAGRTYQLWFIDDAGPQSAGLFAPDDLGRVRLRTPALPADVLAIGITTEPAGGSPAPTGAVVVAGEVG